MGFGSYEKMRRDAGCIPSLLVLKVTSLVASDRSKQMLNPAIISYLFLCNVQYHVYTVNQRKP